MLYISKQLFYVYLRWTTRRVAAGGAEPSRLRAWQKYTPVSLTEAASIISQATSSPNPSPPASLWAGEGDMKDYVTSIIGHCVDGAGVMVQCEFIKVGGVGVGVVIVWGEGVTWHNFPLLYNLYTLDL